MNWQDLAFVATMGLIFAPLEHLMPAGARDWSPRRLMTDVLHLLVGGWIIRWTAFAALVGLGLLISGLVVADWRAAVRAQPGWLAFAELFLLSDLGFYAAHRLVHTVPWLWRCHEVHHSSEHLDWLATYRVHPLDQVVNSTIIALPGIVLGFPPGTILAYALLYKAHAMLLHSNLRVDFGPLRWLIASPHYHHWHHANTPDAYDRNFGGQLVIFDWLFGTLNMPASRPPRYGITAPISPTFVGQLAHPFRPGSLAGSPTGEGRK